MGPNHHSVDNIYTDSHFFFIGFPSTCIGWKHLCKMDFFDNSRKGGTSGRVGILLLENLLLQGKNKAHQCQWPESILLNY